MLRGSLGEPRSRGEQNGGRPGISPLLSTLDPQPSTSLPPPSRSTGSHPSGVLEILGPLDLDGVAALNHRLPAGMPPASF